jgi:phage shock protein PspC (stress-responsive transcriptional regulator)
MDETKRCSYCAEEIRAAAVRCPHCRSRLAGFELEGWHRGHADAHFAGVASAVAHSLSLPVGAVRLGFALLSLVHLIGAMAYAALWLIVPPKAGEPSLLETTLARATERARWLAAGKAAPPSDATRAKASETSGLSPSVISGGDAER